MKDAVMVGNKQYLMAFMLISDNWMKDEIWIDNEESWIVNFYRVFIRLYSWNHNDIDLYSMYRELYFVV